MHQLLHCLQASQPEVDFAISIQSADEAGHMNLLETRLRAAMPGTHEDVAGILSVDPEQDKGKEMPELNTSAIREDDDRERIWEPYGRPRGSSRSI